MRGIVRVFTDPVGKWILRLIRNESIKEEAYDRITHPKDDFEESEKYFLEFFAERTVKWLPIAAMLVLLSFVVDFLLCGSFPNQAYGLTVDLLGAVILGIGLVKGKYTITAESTSYYSKSIPRRRALAQDSVDGIWGITLIIMGIIMQFVATLGINPISLGCLV